MTTFSIIIPAPRGLAHCMPYQQIIGQNRFADAEIIIVDGSGDPVLAATPPAIRQLSLPHAKLYALRQAGIRCAKGEWIVLLEDHCRFLPGYIQAYDAAIRTHPEIDLFSGAVTNLSPPSVISMASFFFGYHAAWPSAKLQPKRSAIANMAIRRSAILSDELALEGGLEYLAIPRLARSGRFAHCVQAVVDHVQNGTLLQHCRMHFLNGRGSAVIAGGLSRESGWKRMLTRVHHCAGVMWLRPLAVIRGVRDFYPARWRILVPMLCLGASHAMGAICGWFTGVGNQSGEY